MQAAMFRLLLQEAEQRRQEVKMSISAVETGDDVPSPEEVQAVLAARRTQKAAKQKREQQQAMHRYGF